MTKLQKKHVIVMYGGRSAEHEVSCRSAAFLLRNLDPAKYHVHALAVDKDGRWLPQDTPKILEALKTTKTVPIERTRSGGPALPASDDPGQSFAAVARQSKEDLVVFPIIHGTFGEDGTLQGLLELAEIAYVGPDTLGSAVGMDKVVAKKLALAAGVPVVPWCETRAQFWQENSDKIMDQAVAKLGFPMFVKPARLGSSVGITKVAARDGLRAAIESALQYDDKILIEKGLDVREIECAVLGDYDPIVSVPGEVIPHAEFYSYEAKYVDAAGASMAIPARLDEAQKKQAQDMAKQVFVALELYGMARVDLFLDKKDGAYYLNEVNTIPGFTEISQYPQLWKASGIEAAELMDRLIALAVARRDQKNRLKRAK